MNREFVLPTSHGPLRGNLALPPAPRGLVLLARLGHRQDDDGILDAGQLGVLSMPLLTEQEMHFPDAAFNVPLLTQRLIDLLDRIRVDGDTEALPLALFAAGHASPAAIRVAARRDTQVLVLACRGGLVDQAGLEALRLLAAPFLMLVDEGDVPAMTSYQRAAGHLSCPTELVRLPPGESPSGQVAHWFGEYLKAI